MMLVSILHLTGAVKNKASHNFATRPTQVILSLSPNHGLFGNGGLCSESKISLETLFNRWSAESWGEYLCLTGAVIGYAIVEQVFFLLSRLAPKMDSWHWLDEYGQFGLSGARSYGVRISLPKGWPSISSV